MKYNEALKIISEYIHIDDKDGIVMSRQCGKSEISTVKIIHRLYLYMKAQNTVYFYRKKSSLNMQTALQMPFPSR